MPMLKVSGVPKEAVVKESKELIDELTKIIECPRDYFSIEYNNNTFIMDGKEVQGPAIVHVYWFQRSQEVQDNSAAAITNHLRPYVGNIDVVFYPLEEKCYYENGEHF